MPSRNARNLTRRMRRAGLTFETAILEQLVEREPDNLDYLAALGEAYTRLRRYRRGLEVDRRLVEREPDDASFRYNLACSLALTGDLDGACAELLRAFELGFGDWAHVLGDPDLRRLRADARFAIVRDHFEALHGEGATEA